MFEGGKDARRGISLPSGRVAPEVWETLDP
jgi:hypothetical protein